MQVVPPVEQTRVHCSWQNWQIRLSGSEGTQQSAAEKHVRDTAITRTTGKHLAASLKRRVEIRRTSDELGSLNDLVADALSSATATLQEKRDVSLGQRSSVRLEMKTASQRMGSRAAGKGERTRLVQRMAMGQKREFDQEIYREAMGDMRLITSMVMFHDEAERTQLRLKWSSIFSFRNILTPSRFFKPPPVIAIKEYLGHRHAYFFSFMHLYTAFLFVMAPLSLIQLVMAALPSDENTEPYLGLDTIFGPIFGVILILASTIFLKVRKLRLCHNTYHLRVLWSGVASHIFGNPKIIFSLCCRPGSARKTQTILICVSFVRKRRNNKTESAIVRGTWRRVFALT